jgi:hypothetical protein
VADLWKPDGTQALDPLDTWDDPTSGLVTGTNFEPEPPVKVEVPTPPMPDISEVMAAVLSDDDPDAPVTPAPRKPEKPERSMLAPELSDTTPGMVAPNVRPGRPRIPMRQLTGLRARAKDEPPLPNPGNRKPQSSNLAIGVIIGLIVVVVVITIVMISSFLSMISSITN